MIITDHRHKLINAIIYFARNTKFCGKTKLLKLLYFLDFCHFRQTGKPVTGQKYYAWKMGPVPRKIFEELTNNMKPDMAAALTKIPGKGLQKIKSKQKFNSDYFSKRELRLLKELSFIFKDATAEQMVESTHLKNKPWDRTLKEKGEFKEIDYLLAVDNNKLSLPYSEVKDRMNEREEVYKIFGVAP